VASNFARQFIGVQTKENTCVDIRLSPKMDVLVCTFCCSTNSTEGLKGNFLSDASAWFVEICAVSKVSKKEIGRVFKLILKNLETSVELITTGDFMVRF